ncbi:MAG: glutathione S-transferase family protein [Pacificimonas sp.]
MPDRMILYGDAISGNCLKVKWTADHLGITHDWHPVDVVAGEARTAAFLRVNPGGKLPAVVLPTGELLTESNAIMHYLARDSALIPDDPLDHTHMLQWMFWEQYSHEPYIAVRRYHLHLAGADPETLDPKLKERGNAALAVMEAHLAGDGTAARDWFVGKGLTLADAALVAYTRWAGQGGFDLEAFPAVRDWVGRVEGALGIDG